MELFSAQLAELGSAGVLVALFFGTFVSEDLACISAGSLIATQAVDPFAAVFACFAGIVVGDVLLFGAGRFFGRRILMSGIGSRLIGARGLDRASEWLSTRGISAIFISRFVSGLRLPVYFLSGVLGLDGRRFVVLVAVGAAIWTPLIVGAAAIWQMTVPIGAIAGLIIAFIVFRLAFRLTDRTRRRIFIGRFKRLWTWEFWPLWLFYAPIVVYVLSLAVRHRGFTFTAANPGMPAGGFVGESKDDIYRLIATSETARQHLPRYVRVPGSGNSDERIRAATEFLEANSLSYPVVLKPDAGERGNGVSIVRSETELLSALEDAVGDILVQEFVEGVEASVFYYRFSGEHHGHIFSITEKVFPFVVGDGVSTLEDLILDDPRAHIIADTYFLRNASRLSDIPLAGEHLALVDIGTHSKGAIFRDGEWMRSEAFERMIDELSKSIPGFFFGRYDLRAESFSELGLGNFKIIELNGVTSESTNIYDPRYSLVDAYKVLFAQWRIAFEIGRRNALAGAERSSAYDLLSLYFKNRWAT